MLKLDHNQLKALALLKERVSRQYNIVSMTIFGSTARGVAEEGSDLDVLMVTKNQLSHQERHDIYTIATEVDWEFDTNISVTIVDEQNWESGFYSILPIKDEVLRDGVVL
jgi:predicted nucleotidyltransferase